MKEKNQNCHDIFQVYHNALSISILMYRAFQNCFGWLCLEIEPLLEKFTFVFAFLTCFKIKAVLIETTCLL